MADLNITQDEADKLMAMQKKTIDQTEWMFPGPADRIVVPLTSLEKRENFLLDVTRYHIKLTKATFQNAPTSSLLFTGWISTERRTATLTAKKSLVPTYIFTVTASERSG